MAYIDVITLAEVKVHLRIDDTLTEDDSAITRMINGALSYIENWTDVYVYARDKTYVMVDGCVRVYAYPINSITTPLEADVESEQKTLHTNYTYGTDTTDLVLNVGHVLPADVPDDLKEVALEIIDLMYYGNGKSYKKDLSELSIDILNSYKRFII
jgi:hypothetical protein